MISSVDHVLINSMHTINTVPLRKRGNRRILYNILAFNSLEAKGEEQEPCQKF